MIDALRQDLRYALRSFARRPAFTLAALIALALGIGANTAVYSVVQAVLIEPLPFPRVEQLVLVQRAEREMKFGAASYERYIDWRDGNEVFAEMGASTSASFTLTESGEPLQLSGARVTASFFRVLAATPAAGRWFTDTEDQPGGPLAVVLGHKVWAERFNADAAVIGRVITIDGERRTIVGIAPADFVFRQEAYVPLAMALEPGRRGNNILTVYARLKAGESLEMARQRMDRFAGTLRDKGDRYTFTIRHLRDVLVARQTERSLLVLMGIVTCVLLIACANVANLLLARAMSRQRELAVRLALGARPWRILRQLVTENLLLAFAGGALGLAVAAGLMRLFLALAPRTFPRLAAVSLDTGVLTFTFLVALLAGLLCSFAPAWHLFRAGPPLAVGGGRGMSAARHARHASRMLAVSEIALALLLVIGASLLVKSLLRIQQQDLGLRTTGVTTFALALPETTYRDAASAARFVSSLVERLRATPGVEAAGGINLMPLVTNGYNGGVRIEGRPAPPAGEEPIVEMRIVTPEYFVALGIPLRAGRFFAERDRDEAAGVVLINEATARRFWPGENPIGRRMATGWDGGAMMREVIGVVGNVRSDSVTQEAPAELYVAHAQIPSHEMTFAVRGAAELPMANVIRQHVAALDPRQPISALRTMDQVVTMATGTWRFSSALASLFAGVAALLALVGVYGVISYSVAQRTREIGVRVALGADAAMVRRLVLREGLRLGAAGVVLGLGGALLLTRLLASQLHGVTPRDPAVFAATSIAVLLCALLAAWWPARRAARVDPIVALRAE